MGDIPMTQAGYDKLQREIRELEAQRPQIKRQIAEAREKGDLRENAEYHAAREALSMLEAKISHVASKLADSHVVNESDAPVDQACLGKTVRILRTKDNREFTRILVGEGEADVSAGKILCTSPIGKAVIGHRGGETVTADLPAGPVEFKILEIS